MIIRQFWIDRILDSWKTRPIVWLSGVRRSGKTTLARMIDGAVFLNCDLPSVVRRIEDPEAFFSSFPKESRIILDEVHRLNDPSGVLKIAADSFHSLKILATGSSTLAATKKFRDSLTGRKWTIYLPPVLWSECRADFNIPDLNRRLLNGGLPESLLSEQKSEELFSEWMDSFYARDIAELFGVRDRMGFLSLVKLLMFQSGGMADYTKLAKESGMSRPTIYSHIEAMTVAHAIFPVLPFHGGGRREIIKRPRLYGFDTGMVTHVRGWDKLREEDRGTLWEHLVLDALRSIGTVNEVLFWRDKNDREIDFVLRRSDKRVDAIECKVNPDYFEKDSLVVFRELYPQGENIVVCPFVEGEFSRTFGKMRVRFMSQDNLIKILETG